MKRLLFLAGILLVPFLLLWGADDWAGRADLYGPAPSQWNWATVTSTTVIKTSPGVLHCATVNTTAAQAWTIRDSSDSASIPVVISTFPTSMTVGDYCYDLATNEGITIMMPASGPNVTITYR